MSRRRAYRPKKHAPPFHLENPEAFPAWVFSPGPTDNEVALRGGPVFEAMAEMGFRVQVLEQGRQVGVGIHHPWTYLFVSVPWGDWAQTMESLADKACSVIMDCHFPIMNLENAIGPDQVLIDTIDRKDTILANLALAEVVTVPHPDWAADLAEINQNVFLLPDLDEKDPGGTQFMSRLATAAQLSGRVKEARTKVRVEMGL